MPGRLVKRSRPLAKAGYWDFFNRPDEVPILQPWNPYGGASGYKLENNRMELIDTNGGYGFEWEALTSNWGFEFMADFDSYNLGSRDFGIKAYIGDNWTKVGVPEQYTLGLALEHNFTRGTGDNEDTARQRIQMAQVDKAEWLFGTTGVASKVLGTSKTTWAGPWPKKVLCRFFNDNDVVIWVDGTASAMGHVGDLPSAPGPGKRAINFAKKGNAKRAFIDSFGIYDYLEALPTFGEFTTHVFDNFNRSSSSTIGNGWTMIGGSQNIISSSVWGVGGFFPSDGYRGIWRPSSPLPGSGAQMGMIKFGGSQAPNTPPTSIILRANSSQSLGIRANFSSSAISIDKITGSFTNPTSTLLGSVGSIIGSAGAAANQTYAFMIWNDYAWVWDVNDGYIMIFAEGINGHSPNTNRHYGATLNRALVNDSGSVDEITFGYKAA